jgi:hypothetical protein
MNGEREKDGIAMEYTFSCEQRRKVFRAEYKKMKKVLFKFHTCSISRAFHLDSASFLKSVNSSLEEYQLLVAVLGMAITTICRLFCDLSQIF